MLRQRIKGYCQGYSGHGIATTHIMGEIMRRAITGQLEQYNAFAACQRQLEGINNRIKVIKRMAYGYRDSEFFFMKIKSVFPGNP